MFKTICLRCGRKIDKGFVFCPFCGHNTKKEKEERDLGFLGKEDTIEFPANFGFTGMPMGKVFNSLMKNLDKQFRELDKNMVEDIQKQNIKGKGISISISTESGKQPKIEVQQFGQGKKIIQPEMMIEKPIMNSKQIEKISNLPKQEAETRVRRLSNKIIYEINLPGVKNIKNVIINKLENSIEIKAFSKEKVYFKLIPINLPILGYKLKNEKLVIELSEKV